MKRLILSAILMNIMLSSALAVQLATSSHISLAVKEDGTLWAWAADRTYTNELTPSQVTGLTDIISADAGSAHVLVLKRDGTVWAWGDNLYGQLGDGTSGYPRFTPMQVIGLSGVIAIAAGGDHSLALMSDGTVWGWGRGNSGQLGNGDHGKGYYSTVPVQAIGISNGIAIAASEDQSLALKRDGTVWNWGVYYIYEVYNLSIYTNTPAQVNGISNVIAVAAGANHSLVLKSDGTVWAWGDNWAGQLGDGNGGAVGRYSLTPVQSLISGVIAIGAGDNYSLALTSYGTVWFWGLMYLDWFGIGSISSIIPVPVESISNVKVIASGGNRVLTLKSDGTILTWGNIYPSRVGERYPVQVKGFSTGGSATVPTSVMAADFDADGKADPTAISSSGELFYWNSGQSFSRGGPISLGLSGSPAVGDADGDSKADMAVVDSAGNWYFFLSSRTYLAEVQNLQPSVNSPQPLLADFDGDGKADPTIVNSSGTWFVWLSGRGYELVTGQFLPPTAYSLQPVAADFDADGRADPVMVTSSGDWYLWPSGSMYTQHGPYNFGVSGKPVAGDFDGDGRVDPAMVDSSGNWNLFLSAALYTRNGPWYLVLP